MRGSAGSEGSVGDYDDEDAEAGHGRRPHWLVLGAIVAATLVGLWLIPDDEAEIPAPLPKVVSGGGEIARPQPAVTAVDPSEGAQGRQILADLRRKGADLDSIHDEARRMERSGHPADAYLLYFEAARQGHGAAALTLARQADPLYFSPRSGPLAAPDLAQAYKWYLVAAKAGQAAAGQDLEALRGRAEAAAAAGDAKARALMLQWQ
jgi:hypothetical protein